jgi:hypothetical protein
VDDPQPINATVDDLLVGQFLIGHRNALAAPGQNRHGDKLRQGPRAFIVVMVPMCNQDAAHAAARLAFACQRLQMFLIFRPGVDDVAARLADQKRIGARAGHWPRIGRKHQLDIPRQRG